MFLMDSGSADSERALAQLAGEALRRARAAAGARTKGTRADGARTTRAPKDKPRHAGVRALIGGLGLGITLRALLDLPGIEHATVVEVFDAVVRWNRGPLVPLNAGALDDPRVTCVVGDLSAHLSGALPADPFDLLLLDVDNGPTWLALPSNRWLYTREGLDTLRGWMKLPAIAAFWATERSPEFESALTETPWGEWSWALVKTPVRPGEPPLECIIYVLERIE
jgi:spermidine synthase